MPPRTPQHFETGQNSARSHRRPQLVQCDGLGFIGTNQTGARSGGLHLHSTLAVTTQGLPLGVLAAQC